MGRQLLPVAGPCLSLPGESSNRPVNIIVPRHYTRPSSLAAQMKSFSDSPPMECVENVTWQ
jgi:hypothetical protein